MPITAPPTIATLSTPPTTADPTTFDSRADTFLSELTPWAGDVGDVADNVYDNATEAFNAATSASTSASTATTQAAAAAASAASALGAPGTNATSTTSLTIGTGSQSLTIQTGKAYSVGQSAIIARTSAPTTRMGGVITSYNSGTGALVVSVAQISGSGTHTDWTISLGNMTGSGTLPDSVITTSTSAVVNTNYLIDADSVVLTAPSSKGVGDLFQYQIMNSRASCSVAFGSDKLFGRTPGTMELASPNSRGKLKWTGATYGWVEA